jgi:GINS complex subunit 4
MNFTDSSNEYNDEVSELNNAWRTEVNCPELLPYKQALIDSMSTSLNSQMVNLIIFCSLLLLTIAIYKQNFIENRVNQTASDMFAISLYQMDIDRIRYSLARYLRTRILKIEENIDLVIARQDIFDNLSMKEQIFAAKLHNTRNEYMDDTFFSKVDDNLKESLEKIYNRMKETQPNLQVFDFMLTHLLLYIL